jgi:two-component system, NtrC family, sensor kinase
MSVKNKVTAVTVITCMVALVVASLLLFRFEMEQFQKRFTADIDSIKQITGIYSSGALAFQDQKTAEEILDGLKSQPNIVSACIEDQDGGPLAVAGNNADFSAFRARAKTAGNVMLGSHLVAWQPVTVGGVRVGTVYLRVDYGGAYMELFAFAGKVFGLVVLVSFFIALLISRRLQGLVTRPIMELAETSRSIATKGDYSLRARKQGEDELGMLTDSFNQMLDHIQAQDTALRREIADRERAERELRQTQEKLVATSRQAGMAEVATGVLHNVGNVLNSVNISTTLISETLRRAKIDNLVRASELLKTLPEDASPEALERARLLPGYLAELSAELRQFHDQMAQEAGMLEKNVGHIRDIVAMQQDYARVGGVVEQLSPESLVADAIQMNEPAFERQGITLRCQGSCNELISADRHKLLLILVNLLRNARHALEESGRADKEITVSIEKNGADRIKIIVADNGIGIPAENLTRIFSHGFTTRAEGHGFGLHTSANAARETGGTLSATSDGPGLGSRFTLELPLAVNQPHIK